MKQFDIYAYNLQKGLANVTEILAKNAINIKAISSENQTEELVLIRIVTDDEKTTKKTLDVEKLNYKEREIISVKLADRPGELAKMAFKLARAKIRIDSIYMLGKDMGWTELALCVSDPKKAKVVLK